MSSNNNNGGLLSGLYGRSKTLSECSGTDTSEHLPPGSELMGLNLAAENHLYDMDGVFAYTYYEKKPEMYCMEGKIRYKFFNHLKRPEVSRVQNQGRRNRSFSESSTGSLPESASPPTETLFNRSDIDVEGRFAYRVFDPKMDAAYFKTHQKENEAKKA